MYSRCNQDRTSIPPALQPIICGISSWPLIPVLGARQYPVEGRHLENRLAQFADLHGCREDFHLVLEGHAKYVAEITTERSGPLDHALYTTTVEEGASLAIVSTAQYEKGLQSGQHGCPPILFR